MGLLNHTTRRLWPQLPLPELSVTQVSVTARLQKHLHRLNFLSIFLDPLQALVREMGTIKMAKSSRRTRSGQ